MLLPDLLDRAARARRDLDRKLGSIGKPMPNVNVTVRRDDGTVAGPGETGEVVARGDNIALGYWGKADETAHRFSPEGYRTGDLGYRDDEGFLFLIGRRHDMIKIGANRVGAKEIEDVLCSHPAVLETAVVGIPHDLLGEAPIAFVMRRDATPLDAGELAAFARRRLAPYKVPVESVLLSDLPRMAMGKIDRAALRAHAGTMVLAAKGAQ